MKHRAVSPIRTLPTIFLYVHHHDLSLKNLSITKKVTKPITSIATILAIPMYLKISM